jgi:hypothetical protein
VAAHSGSSCARRSGLASPNARPRRAPLPDLGRARPPASGDDEGPRPTSHAALLRPQRRDACSVPNAWATCSGTASLADVGGGHFRDTGEGLPVPGPGRICRRPPPGGDGGDGRRVEWTRDEHGRDRSAAYSVVGPAARTTFLLGHGSSARTTVLLGRREYIKLLTILNLLLSLGKPPLETC